MLSGLEKSKNNYIEYIVWPKKKSANYLNER